MPKLPWAADFLVDTVRQDPAPGAAVLQGLFFGRIAPHRAERRTLRTETLVIGHRRDPLHPFSDAGTLAEELPNARLLVASSIVELRLAPKRLTGEIADFIDACWKPRRATAPPASELAGLGVALHGGHQLVELGRGGRRDRRPATASATQWRTWPSRTRTETCSSAVWTAETWVRMSTQ